MQGQRQLSARGGGEAHADVIVSYGRGQREEVGGGAVEFEALLETAHDYVARIADGEHDPGVGEKQVGHRQQDEVHGHFVDDDLFRRQPAQALFDAPPIGVAQSHHVIWGKRAPWSDRALAKQRVDGVHEAVVLFYGFDVGMGAEDLAHQRRAGTREADKKHRRGPGVRGGFGHDA